MCLESCNYFVKDKMRPMERNVLFVVSKLTV